MHETSQQNTQGQFGPVLLPKASKNDDEELCFLKQFGYNRSKNLLLDDLAAFPWNRTRYHTAPTCK